MRVGFIIAMVFVLGLGGFGCSQPAPQVETVEESPAPPEPVVETAPPAEEPDEPAIGEEEASVEAVVAEVAEPETPAAPQPVVEGGVPKLVVPEPEFDFGQKDNTEQVEHKFVLRNEGTGMLKIENIRASCGCTATAADNDEVAPGEETKVLASTDLRGRQGRQTKTVTVMTNDPETPSVTLRIVGEAIASITIDPMSIQLGRILDNEPREATAVIASTKDDVSFKVLSAEATGVDFVEHEIEEVIPGKKYKLHIKTAGDLPTGNHNARFIIRTDSQERAVIWLPVTMQVIGALQVMPPVINIRYSEEPEEVTQQQLSITPGRISEFEITEVVLPLDTMEYDLIEAQPGHYRLILSNMPLSDALEEKSILLRTNVPDHPEIEIPVNIIKPRLRQIPRPSPQTMQQLQRPPQGVEDVADTPAGE